MARPVTWYSDDLGDRDPLPAMAETCERIRRLVEPWPRERLERPYAPGKWTARQILIHLAQTELALGYRVRMALATDGYAAQNFDQDRWMVKEAHIEPLDALHAMLALNRMNRGLFATLSDADLATGLTHPEIGDLTVDWIVHQLAGHHIHHLRQLERI
jgi:hypothetical protein